MKSIFAIIVVLGMFLNSSAQNSNLVEEVPENIMKLGSVESVGEVKRGNSIEFEFNTELDKQVTMDVYNKEGKQVNSVILEVYSEKGLALTTRSFDPGTYYVCLVLSSRNLIKKITVVE